jgi:2-phosphosulfolactate phosphatase
LRVRDRRVRLTGSAIDGDAVQLDVAFLPRDVTEPESAVCIVIDALRATSTIATALARAARDVVVAGTVDEARRLKAAMPEALLCGEVGGLPPEGFDHGNSPVELEGLDLDGRRLILATSNGTRALSGLRSARAVFTGSLLNLSACARQAAGAAAGDGSLTIVCSGTELGTTFSLEDAVVAGAFVERVAGVSDGGAVLSDAATAALRLWRSYGGRPRAAFDDALHGGTLVRIGMAADLDRCAEIDRYAVVPRLRVVDGLLVLSGDAT